MKMRAAALVAALAVVGLTACPPPATAPGPPGVDVVIETIKKAINWLWGTPPDNTNIDCSVVLFDQSVNANDSTATWNFVHYIPQLLPLQLSACFPMTGRGAHTVPTTKASGYPNNPNASKRAVCWVESFNPVDLGGAKFKCSFDRRADFGWVVYLELSRDGFLAVGGH